MAQQKSQVDPATTDQVSEQLKKAGLTEVVDRYLSDLEAGRAPSREEYLSRYAELGPEFQACLDSLELIHQVAPQMIECDRNVTSGSSDSSITPLVQLGDFRIQRELGRGGMGIVYEAEQMSLGRRVAVKVLPFAGMLHGNQLQRFKSEAQAAASLHHPNIVNAFFVGQERGVHYYAMRLIDGQSVAEIIDQLRAAQTRTNAQDKRLRSPSVAEYENTVVGTDPIAAISTALVSNRRCFYRNVARLTVDAAEALAYSHSMGIVHRDIKPSNLLVDRDGVLWITDFGIAATQTETHLTLTGDLLGTLRYMSPERAAGDMNTDPRADIYSLGATLYEWITLQPVLAGTSRAELLRQLAERDAARPRMIDSKIPRDLENILLKSIARLPSDRYSSADQMANDLRRFLGNKPVIARRPSNLEWTLRWADRNRSFAGVLIAAFLLLLALAVGGPLVAVRQHLIVESEAAARRRAEEMRRIARDEQTKATESAERAKKSLQRLQDFLHRALIHTIGAGAGRPEVVELQRQMLRDTIHFYKDLPELSDDPKLRFDTAVAYRQMAVLNSLIHAVPQEDTSWLCDTSVKMLQHLVARQDTFDHRRELAQSMNGMARFTDDTSLAISFYRQAIDVSVETKARYPDRPEPLSELGWCHTGLAGISLEAGRLAEAEERARASVLGFEGLIDNGGRAMDFWGAATAYRTLSQIYSEQNRWQDAEKAGYRSIRFGEQSLKDLERIPLENRPAAQLSVNSRENLAIILHCLGKSHEAERELRRAIDAKKNLRKAFPHNSDDMEIIWDYERLSDLLLSDGRPREAEELVRKCLESVSSGESLDSGQRSIAGWLHYRLGQILWRAGKRNEATVAFVQAEEHLEHAAAARPDSQSAQRRFSPQRRLAIFWTTCLDSKFRRPQAALDLMRSTHHRGFGGSWSLLALAQYRSGEWEKALESVAESTRLRAGGDPVDWLMRAMTHARSGHQKEAIDWYRRANEGLDQNMPISFGVGVVWNYQDALDLKAEAEELVVPDDLSSEAARGRTDESPNAGGGPKTKLRPLTTRHPVQRKLGASWVDGRLRKVET